MMRNLIFVLFICLLTSCRAQEQKSSISTASENVSIIDSSFNIIELERARKIRVYLPPNYDESIEHYPVLYMHDGQNLFDDLTSYVGEWGVDETMNKLSDSLGFNLIVVGIDNGQEKRVNEMAPWDHEKFGKAEGDLYISFIIDQIKPFIDSTYRTLSDRANTAMMGSSMGGLITHYGVFTNPDVFSKAGIFSPSYWFADEIFTFTEENPVPTDTKLFINVGSKEGSDMEKPAKQMADIILESGHPKSNIYFENVIGGNHGEAFWKQEFEAAIRWLYELK